MLQGLLLNPHSLELQHYLTELPSHDMLIAAAVSKAREPETSLRSLSAGISVDIASK
jgi:hypothetical protein